MELDFRVLFSIVFFSVLTFYFFKKRSAMQTSGWFPFLYFSMYRAKWGMKAMDKYAKKYPRILSFLSVSGIIVGFLGMIFIAFSLIDNLISLFTIPDAPSGVGVVLPFKAKGVFYVPIEYWLISIFIIAAVHEFAHGIIARLYKMKVKSTGFAFLGIGIPVIPAAFVEPDEKQVRKKPLKHQLGMFAAGPFSNIILGFLCLGVLFALSPVSAGLVEGNGVEISQYVSGDFPAQAAGMDIGEVIVMADGKPTPYISNLSEILATKRPNQRIQITTDKETYQLTLGTNPQNESKAYLGAYLAQSTGTKQAVIDKYGPVLPEVIVWFSGLFVFLFILNIGIGLFNLLPLGPLDGGRMLYATLLAYVPKKKAEQLFSLVSLVFLLIVLVNIGFSFIR